MQYTKCIKCNNDWNKELSYNLVACYKCNVDYYYGPSPCISISNILKVGDDLSFFFRENKCHYYTSGKIVVLPMLDFDISADKLKILILFS